MSLTRSGFDGGEAAVEPLLANTAFRRFLTERSLSTLAFQVQGVAVGFQLYQMTHEVLVLGLVGLTQFLPMLATTLFAGYLADNFDRRRVVAICQLLQAGVAIALALATQFHVVGVGHVLALVAIAAAARACEQPTEQALLPNLLPRATFPRAMALATSVNQACVIVGPALGGLLAGLSPVAPYCTGLVLLVLAAISVSRIPLPRRQETRVRRSLSALFSGLAFVASNRDVLGSISLDLLTVLFGGATALLPAFATDVLHVDAFGLGLLRGAPAGGALVMSLLLTRLRLTRPGLTMLFTSAAFGLLTVGFALSTAFLLSLALLFALGCVNVVGVVIRNSLVQLRTPDELRGRVAAVNSLFTGTSNQLGDFEAGLTAAFMGPVGAVAFGGICSVLVALAWLALFPEIRRLRALGS